jgi:hypothetical protein
VKNLKLGESEEFSDLDDDDYFSELNDDAGADH